LGLEQLGGTRPPGRASWPPGQPASWRDNGSRAARPGERTRPLGGWRRNGLCLSRRGSPRSRSARLRTCPEQPLRGRSTPGAHCRWRPSIPRGLGGPRLSEIPPRDGATAQADLAPRRVDQHAVRKSLLGPWPFWARTWLAVASVYGVMAIDLWLRLWGRFGLDYSTHTALAVSLSTSIAMLSRRWLILLVPILFAYTRLMMALGYHSAADIGTTALLVAPTAWLIHRLTFRRSTAG